ncbi:hypothetical protein B296_00005437 [Ensete ventricosum]|uniref:Uncharacterized protein n=1 Tax=Ensete ventricosum TaxID=4639 RepID=A0A427A8A0_ENSVE|nr:hypothetical protein B296_00005437 [Ensete ventricosum]
MKVVAQMGGIRMGMSALLSPPPPPSGGTYSSAAPRPGMAMEGKRKAERSPPLPRETLHAGNPRSAGVDTPVVILMRVFLPSLRCSYKTRPPEWWVPGEVPPTIKLGLVRRVKSDVLFEHRRFFSFLDGSGEGE